MSLLILQTNAANPGKTLHQFGLTKDISFGRRKHSLKLFVLRQGLSLLIWENIGAGTGIIKTQLRPQWGSVYGNESREILASDLSRWVCYLSTGI